MHFAVVVSQGTDRTDQIEFLKQLRVISDNAKLGRNTFVTIVCNYCLKCTTVYNYCCIGVNDL